MIKRVIAVLLVAFVLAQFLRPERNVGEATGPDDIAHTVTVPDNVQQMLQRSCYDCHSNHTTYPWYAHVNPLGNWLGRHVSEGKKELNFTIAGTYSKKKLNHKLDEIAEQLQKREMPLGSYTLIHRDAALSNADVTILLNWVKAAKADLGAGQ